MTRKQSGPRAAFLYALALAVWLGFVAAGTAVADHFPHHANTCDCSKDLLRMIESR